MMKTNDRLQQPPRVVAESGLQLTADGVESQADGLVGRAQESQEEQAAQLEATPLESQYSAAFAVHVEAKHDQVERIEDRLEGLIERHASRMQQAQTNQPGMLALPGIRAKWHQQMQQQQQQMQRLQGRLEVVREIKDGMSIHGPRIEELATRKLRAQEPELASEWDEMREAQRRHVALIRKQEQEKRLQLEREQKQAVSRGLRLGLSQAR